MSSPAIKILKKPKDVTSLLGTAAVFEVVISEDNIPVRWMFNGVELKTGDDHNMISEKKIHKLVVKNVNKSKEGEYTAVVGHLQTSARLTVEGQCLAFCSFSLSVQPSVTCHRYFPISPARHTAPGRRGCPRDSFSHL